MVDVRLPDGRVARFPDDMPREEIRSFISSKFPEAAPTPVQNPEDILRGQIVAQRERDAAAKPVASVEGNPYASSLPGPLGQFQNTSSAFQQGAIEGMTANFSNELASAAIAPFDAMGRAVQGQGFDVGQSYNDIYAAGNDRAANLQALNPDASGAGHVTGGLVLGQRLGGLSPIGRATTPMRMAGLGALEGGIYGAAYGYGGAEGNFGERAVAAGPEAAIGTVAGGLIGYGAGRLTQPVSEEARILNRGLTADGIDPMTVNSRINALDPNSAVLADLGPNLQGQSAAIATLPGPGSRTVVDALTARRTGANDRIRTSVAEALGNPNRVSEVVGELDTNRQAVNQLYEPIFRAKALSNDPFMDAAPIVTAVDNMIPNVVGKTRTKVENVRNMLIDPTTGAPTNDPQVIMAVRQELDGMIGAETNTTTQKVLGDLRKAIDIDLGAAVPGLKDVDAQFAEIARQGESLEQGGMLLNDGKTAIDPADLIEQMLTATPGQNFRLSQGAKAEVNRIIGTKANDRVALRGIVRGDGSWNEQKLRAVLGDDAADQLMAIIDREATMAATENLATSGSRTQVLKAAQDDFSAPRSSIAREALNFQYGNAAARMADNVLGGAISARREGVTSNVAQALMARQLTPEMERQLVRIQLGLPANERAFISALLSGQASRDAR